MEKAIAEEDWESQSRLIEMSNAIEGPKGQTEVLNRLLVMPGHQLHQEVAMRIQQLGSDRSVPFIRSVLERGFGYLQYTCSEDETIAKWFSHALARIGTPGAIDLIKEYASSSNHGIAKEMQYRLEKLGFSSRTRPRKRT
ncbi:HEAT repeat domain-containing protein [Janthinobacterium sp. RB2R34]|uniref:HEAT repeat domain-containing protein n=1 Tax=Janthinobacterium sp. RB2R34 TaxID=3424193 RepID=UPI003F1F17EC